MIFEETQIFSSQHGCIQGFRFMECPADVSGLCFVRSWFIIYLDLKSIRKVARLWH